VAATFLLIRHAAHVHLDRVLSGRLPHVPLSGAGRAQAQRLAARLANGPIDRIVCSPLDRTRETAEAIAEASAIQAEQVEALVEIDMGDWTGRGIESLAGDPTWAAWNAHRGTARIPGGETMAEAQARVVACLGRLATSGDGQSIAVVTHADMIRATVAHVLGLALDHLLRFDVDPASVTRLVWGDWGARLLTLNEQG
jgi:broad specificity phosphatase PhoE